jgi:hypothetical protein
MAIVRRAALSRMSWSRRRCRVSTRLGLTTQWMAVRRYHGGWASKNAAALEFARRVFSSSGVSFAAALRSKA